MPKTVLPYQMIVFVGPKMHIDLSDKTSLQGLASTEMEKQKGVKFFGTGGTGPGSELDVESTIQDLIESGKIGANTEVYFWAHGRVVDGAHAMKFNDTGIDSVDEPKSIDLLEFLTAATKAKGIEWKGSVVVDSCYGGQILQDLRNLQDSGALTFSNQLLLSSTADMLSSSGLIGIDRAEWYLSEKDNPLRFILRDYEEIPNSWKWWPGSFEFPVYEVEPPTDASKYFGTDARTAQRSFVTALRDQLSIPDLDADVRKQLTRFIALADDA